LTQDLDFSAEIAVLGQAYPSVVLLRLSSSRIETVNAVLSDVLPALEQDVSDGALITRAATKIATFLALGKEVLSSSEKEERPRCQWCGSAAS
jgi:hypothetical protein